MTLSTVLVLSLLPLLKESKRLRMINWQLMVTKCGSQQFCLVSYEEHLLSYSGRREKTENQIPGLNCKNG